MENDLWMLIFIVHSMPIQPKGVDEFMAISHSILSWAELCTAMFKVFCVLPFVGRVKNDFIWKFDKIMHKFVSIILRNLNSNSWERKSVHEKNLGKYTKRIFSQNYFEWNLNHIS